MRLLCHTVVLVLFLDFFFENPPFSGEPALAYVLTNSIQGEQVCGKIKMYTYTSFCWALGKQHNRQIQSQASVFLKSLSGEELENKDHASS